MSIKVKLFAVSALVATTGLTWGQQPPAAGVDGRGAPGAPNGAARAGRGGAGFVSAPTFDKEPPVLPANLKPGGVLIFSKTNGFRDDASIQASNAALAAIAHERGWPFFITENGAVMNKDQLEKFKVVVWNNTSGDTLTADQRTAFKTWMENGGSFVGTHGSGGDPVNSGPGRTSAADWKWYVDTLIGAQFVVHSSIQPGDIHVEDLKSPITKGLPALWHRAEEWYSFADNPRAKPGYHILLTVDEQTYTPGRATMGADHPLAWWHCVEKGHVFYSALGHAASMYSEELIIQLYSNAISWGLAENGRSCAAGK
jgi:type 1 glutamine amidotransferase